MSQNITIMREFGFDAGHRVPSHAGKCRSPHGHRYKVQVWVGGLVQDAGSGAEEGMVKDFGILKSLFAGWVDKNWDHAMLIYEKDTELLEKFRNTDWKHVVLPVVPTAEGLVGYLFTVFNDLLHKQGWNGVYVTKITLWETPNCSATIEA